MDRRGLRRGRRRPAAARQAHRRVGRSATSRRLQAGRPRPRRDLRRQQHQPSAARDAHGDGLLAERQALHALLDAEHDADRSAPSRAGSASSRQDVVIISEYTGGGFGSKGSSSVFVAVAGAAVEEGQRAGDDAHHARARSSTSAARGRRCTRASRSASARTAASPRSTASSSSTTARTTSSATARSAGDHISLSYQPLAMRWRSADGADQHAAARRAARAGRDAGQRADGADPGQGGAQARHRRGRDPPHQRARGQGAVRRAQRARRAELRRPARSSRRRSTRAPSCSTGKSARRGAAQRNGSKVRGVGVAVSAYSAGSMGFDGLFVIKPDGRDDDPVGHRQPRHRVGVRRATASPPRLLGMPWEKVRRHLGQHREEPAHRPAARAAARRRTR